jgi:hypothetical protein
MEHDKSTAKLRKVLDFFMHVITTTLPSQYGHRKPMIHIPTISSDLSVPLFQAATINFWDRTNRPSYRPSYTCDWDLHGNLSDLIRFLHDFGLPPDQSLFPWGEKVGGQEEKECERGRH